MDKPNELAAKNPIPIGKFSQICWLSIKTLHFWDEVGLLKPAIVDPESNYRYYTVEQIPLASDIFYFTHMARMPLDEASVFLNADPKERKGMLERHLERLEHQIAELQTHATLVRQFLLHPEKPQYWIETKEIVPQPTALICMRSGLDADRITQDRKQAFDEIYSLLEQQGIAATGAPYCEFSATQKGKLNDFQVWMGVDCETTIMPIGRVEASERVGGLFACTVHQGHYYFLGEAHAALRLWMQEHGHSLGISREYYLCGPRDTQVLEYHRTEVCYKIV